MKQTKTKQNETKKKQVLKTKKENPALKWTVFSGKLFFNNANKR